MAGVPIENVAAGRLAVGLSLVDSLAGKVRPMAEVDPGVVTGTALLRSGEVDDDYRQRIGHDTPLDQETFSYTAQNTGKHQYLTATMTASWSGNYLTTNSGSITTNSTGVQFSTWRTFPLYDSAPTYCEATLAITAGMPTNTTIDVGLYSRATGNPFVPLDGAYFRISASGVYGVVNYSGTEDVGGAFVVAAGGATFVPTANQQYKFSLVFHESAVEFWIDDVLMAKLPRGSIYGQPQSVGAAHFALRHAIAGGTASGVVQARLAKYSVSLGGYNTGKPWPHIAAGMGLSGQGLSGGTMGSVAQYAGSNTVAAAGPSNTSGLAGLGGQSHWTATATAITDFITTTYLNPAHSTTLAGRTLYITGVRISCANLGAVVATTPTLLAWSLAWGHTASSLATTETASTKASRRLALGMMSAAIGTVVGGMYDRDIHLPLSSPIAVAPGENVACVYKVLVGTATALQSIYVLVGLDHYWE